MNLERALTRLLGTGVVRTDAETVAIHATDRWFASRTPDAVVLARTRGDVEKTLIGVSLELDQGKRKG